MVAERAGQTGFIHRLGGGAADAGDQDRLRFGRGLDLGGGSSREFEDGFEQTMPRITNRELGRMNADSKASRTGREIVSGESPLPAFVQVSPAGQGQWMRRDDQSLSQSVAHPSRRLRIIVHGVS